jgi:hypothetical protein
MSVGLLGRKRDMNQLITIALFDIDQKIALEKTPLFCLVEK